MKLLKGIIENFGSYKNLSFDFSNPGLTLIQGATGSGKSTLADIAGWILFGITAKGGAVDDIRSWANGDVTAGYIRLNLGDSTQEITVGRVRGQKPKDNDLYWQEGDSDELKRGKDLQDTQKLLEKRLGFSSDIYFTASYFNEFSASSNFFVAKAKERRELLEKIANLNMPITLASKIVEARKPLKSEIIELNNKLSKEQGKIETLEESISSTDDFSKNWEHKHLDTIASLEAKYKHFEKLKADKISAILLKKNSWDERIAKETDKLIDRLEIIQSKIISDDHYIHALECIDVKINKAKDTRCTKCNSPKDLSDLYETQAEQSLLRQQNQKLIDNKETLLEALEAMKEPFNPFEEELENSKLETNHYKEQITSEKSKTNPHSQAIQEFNVMLENASTEVKRHSHDIEVSEHRLSLLDRLYGISFNLRGALLEQAVKQIEDKTNAYLEKHFDAEIRVGLTLDPSGDALDISIQKSGYDCNYKQLSKGQRGLLKLTFAVALMSIASDKAGIHFDNLWFDEALDGLDDGLKVKAFDLFTELSQDHNSIYVIDHCENLKTLFEQSYYVELIEDNSVLHES